MSRHSAKIGAARKRLIDVVQLNTIGLALGAILCGCYSAPSRPTVSPEKTTAAAASAPASRPDIVLITLDTTRADYVDRGTMPFLSEFRRHGVDFTEAQTSFNETEPAHASILTGLRVFKHGIVCNLAQFQYPARLPTVLHRAGYQTAAFVSAEPLRRGYGLNQGFDTFDDGGPIDPRATDSHRPGCRTVDAALNWMRRRDTSRPMFLWVHLFDPHAPYDPPDLRPSEKPVSIDELMNMWYSHRQLTAGEIARVRNMYRRELRETDELLRGIHEGVTAASNRGVLWAIVGDHGEEMLDHGNFAQHNWSLYQGVLHVPLVLRWDGKLPANEVSAPVRTLCLTPSILSLLKLPQMPDTMEPLPLDGKPHTTSDEVIISRRSPTYGWTGGGATAVRIGRHKAIFFLKGQPAELYDLAIDPGELNNIASGHPEILAQLKKRLSDVAPVFLTEAKTFKMDDKKRDALRSLGYIQ